MRRAKEGDNRVSPCHAPYASLLFHDFEPPFPTCRQSPAGRKLAIFLLVRHLAGRDGRKGKMPTILRSSPRPADPRVFGAREKFTKCLVLRVPLGLLLIFGDFLHIYRAPRIARLLKRKRRGARTLVTSNDAVYSSHDTRHTRPD